uniref:Uncharacterized protein n=1 Tax=Anguilla anguilla TaxID=7936 RepID=A0A0E9WTF5_ANGAN
MCQYLYYLKGKERFSVNMYKCISSPCTEGISANSILELFWLHLKVWT